MPNSLLFSPLPIRSVILRNRIGVSPMCQYSSTDGFPNDWHVVHLGSRAVGGAGLVMTEATAVAAIGRISPGDTGIWNDAHIDAWKKVTAFVESQGSIPGIQLAHAGRKASTAAPWDGGLAVSPADGGWEPIGPGAERFGDGYPVPRAMTETDFADVLAQYVAAAKRALAAGFRVIEIHSAHGYLLHSLLSPVTNKRTDEFGGAFEQRTKFLVELAKQVRSAIGEAVPLFVRLSCSDWIEGGWTIRDSVHLTSQLREVGVDAIDCSSGGIAPDVKIPIAPGYQTEFAGQIRTQTGIKTAAVGLITDGAQAETILRTGQADLVFLAREMLRDPYWPRRVAKELGIDPADFTPKQYTRSW